MNNPCKNCANCKQQQNSETKKLRFWCNKGAFDFHYVPEDDELDFEYIQSICTSFESMDE